MATKKTKSNVSKSTQLTQFKFKWWMAVLGIGVVAIVGIVILRYSHAGASITYNASQFSSLPGNYINAQLINDTSGKVAIQVYRLNNNGAVIIPLQLFAGSYRGCAFGKPVPGVAGSYINVIVTKPGTNDRYTNSASFSSTNPVCVNFNTYGATAPVDFRMVNSGGGGNNMDISGFSIEAQ